MTDGIHILALSGTNGSGKDTVGALLAQHHNFKFMSFTDEFREECARRGIPPARENLRTVSAEWRRQFGPAVMVDRTLESFKKAGGTYAGVVVSSLRNPFEADRIHELGGQVIWIDADPHIRYTRVQANAKLRNRGAEDDKTFEQFLTEQEAEMHPPAGSDENVLNMAAVKDRADIFIQNDINDLETFHQTIINTLHL